MLVGNHCTRDLDMDLSNNNVKIALAAGGGLILLVCTCGGLTGLASRAASGTTGSKAFEYAKLQSVRTTLNGQSNYNEWTWQDATTNCSAASLGGVLQQLGEASDSEDEPTLVQAFNQFGRKGWELVSCDYDYEVGGQVSAVEIYKEVWIFKRNK